MLKKGERICPCCGDILQLEAPNSENAPQIIGYNGIKPYYATRGKFPSRNQKVRIFRYTSPSHKYFFPVVKREYSDYASEHGVYLDKAESLLRGDRVFNTSLVMFCGHCRSQIAVDRNPLRLIRYCSIYPLSVMLVGALLSCIWFYAVYIAAAGLLCETVLLVCSLIYYMVIMKCYSNFVVVDDCDRLVRQSTDLIVKLSAGKEHISRFICCESNIFSVSENGITYRLHTNNSDINRLELHICGVDKESEQLTSLLKDRINAEGKAVIPLQFEGKFIGNAEVIEVCRTLPQTDN